MERRSFIRSTGLAGVLAAGAAPAIVHAQASVRWRCASSFPNSLDTIFGGGQVFAKKVGEMSGGKFQISVHAAGELLVAYVCFRVAGAARGQRNIRIVEDVDVPPAETAER